MDKNTFSELLQKLKELNIPRKSVTSKEVIEIAIIETLDCANGA